MSGASSVILPTILQNLYQLSQSKARCSSALQSISEGRCVKPSQDDETVGNSDANLIVLASFLIDRLLHSLRHHHKKVEAPASRPSLMQEQAKNASAVALAALSHSLSTVLLVDRTKFERIMNHTSSASEHMATASRTKATDDSRIILGRAFLNSVMGALAAIDTLSRAEIDCLSHNSFEPFVRDALVASLFALEMMTKFNVKPSSIGTYHIHRNNAPSSKSPLNTEKDSSSTTPFHLSPLDSIMMTDWNDLMKAISSDIRFRSKKPFVSTRVGKQANASAPTMDAADFCLSHICSLVSTDLFKDDGGSDISALFFTILHQVGILQPDTDISTTESSHSPPRKRTKFSSSKTRSSQASGDHSNAFLLPNAATVIFATSLSAFDMNIPLRRWASAALVWFCDGQGLLLRAAINLLSTDSFDSWSRIIVSRHDVMDTFTDNTGTEALLNVVPKKTRKSEKVKTKSLPDKEETEHRTLVATKVTVKGDMFGNTTLLAYVLRLVDLVCDVGRVCEVPESVGLQSYLNKVWPFPPNTNVDRNLGAQPQPKGRGRRKKDVFTAESHSFPDFRPAVRSDIRQEISVLMILLLVAHNRCIHDNVAMQLLEKMCPNESNTPQYGDSTKYVLLTDEYYTISRKRNGANNRYFEYCPCVDEVITNMAHCAALSSSSGDLDDTRNRLMAVGLSLALSLGQVFLSRITSTKPGNLSIFVVDARLSSKAIELLGTSFNEILSNNEGKEGSSEKPSTNEESKRCDIFHPENLNDFKESYGLHESLLPQPLPRTRNITSNDLKAVSSKLSPSVTNNGIKRDEIVSLFIRSFKTGDISLDQTAFKLLESVFRIVGACFSFHFCQKEVMINKACDLAARCLQSIHNCLKSYEFKGGIASKTNISLICALSRSFISTASISSVVSLGIKLNKYLEDKESESGASEMIVWESHVNLSKAFGRAIAFSKDIDVMKILKIVASTSSLPAASTVIDESDLNTLSWPLSLPSIHYPLIISYLSSTLSVRKDSTIHNISYEWIICEAIIDSIHIALRRFDAMNSNEYRLCSRRDVDILILAANCLPRAKHLQLLSLLIGVVSDSVSRMKAEKKLRAEWFQYRHISSLVARLITTTATLIDLASSGFGQQYSRNLGFVVDSCFPFPSRSTSIHHSDSHGNAADSESFGFSYKDDEILDSLFDVSFCLSDKYDVNLLPEAQKLEYRSALELSLELGLEAARYDGGYLMFAAWNACSRSDLWYSVQWTGVTPPNVFHSTGNGAKIMSLRKDMCFLYSEIRRNSDIDGNYLSATMCALNENSGLDRVTLIKDGVIKMIEVLNNVEQLVGSDDDDRPSAIQCCMLETLSCFVSFLSSTFTTTDFQYLYSSDTNLHELEDFSSGDGNSCMEVRINLHEACESQGLSPYFPDRLDYTCHLRSGISRLEAMNITNSLIQSLLQFGRWVIRNFFISLKRAIPKSDTINAVSFPTLSVNRVHDQSYRVWSCCIEDDLLECLVKKRPTKSIEDAARRKFVKSSASLWIRGLLDDFDLIDSDDMWAFSMGELRTNGEWEMIMADALIGACSTADGTIDDRRSNAMLYPIRWKRILNSVLDALVTAVALFRFSVDQEKNDMSESNYDTISPKPLDGNQTRTILDVLSFMTEITTCDEMNTSIKKTAQSIANTLLFNEKDSYLITGVISSAKLMRDISQLHFAYQHGNMRSQNMVHYFETLISHVDAISGEQLLLCLCYSNASIRLFDGNCTSFQALLPHLARFSSAFGGEWEKFSFRLEYLTPIFYICMKGSTLYSIDSQLQTLSLIERGLNVNAAQKAGKGNFLEDLWYLWNQMDNEQCRLISDRLKNFDRRSQSILCDRKLCAVLGSIICSDISCRSTSLTAFSEYLLSDMIEWTKTLGLDHLFYLASIISLRFDMAEVIVNDVLGRYDLSTMSHLHYIDLYFSFLCDLARNITVSDTKVVGRTTAPPFTDWGIKLVTRADVLNCLCTFDQTGEDFMEQHWYNCYTCGLMWDRGCCRVCALLCHEGHDVGYSRFSAFFCDCGATGTKDGGVLSSCRCVKKTLLSTLKHRQDEKKTPHRLLVAPQAQKTALNREYPASGNRVQTRSPLMDPQGLDNADYCSSTCTKVDYILIASNINPLTLTNSLRSIAEGVVKDQLPQKLFKMCHALAGSIADSWNNNGDSSWHRYRQTELVTAYRYRCEDLRLRSRVQLTASSTVDFVPKEPFKDPLMVRSANVHNGKFLDGRNNLTTKVVGKTSFSRRMLLAADNHARLYIAEQYRVSFFPASSLLRTMAFESYHDSAIEKNIVGSSKVDFIILGLKIPKENDRHVLVWGISDAVVLIMNERSTRVESKVTLISTRDDVPMSENDSIIQTDWVPGTSGTILVLYFAKNLKIYDIRKSLEVITVNEHSFSCSASVVYSMTQEISSVSLIQLNRRCPDDFNDRGRDAESSTDNRYLFFCIFQSGHSRILNFRLCTTNWDIYEQDEILVDFGEGGQLSSPSATGDRYYTCFLPQSSIMLRQSSSSPVVALMYDEQRGDFTENFQLLPHSLDDGLNVRGPYLNWTELGIIQREGKWFYRLLCIGSCSSSNREKLLYLEFNRYKTLVKAVKGTGNSENSMFEGTAVFSLPMYDSMNANGDVEKRTRETIFFSALRSDGSFFLFEERDTGTVFPTATQLLAHDENTIKPLVNPFTIFESLICVTNTSDCIVDCDVTCNESDENARKLSVGLVDLYYAPKKPGHTFTISLKARTRLSYYCMEDYAIVAIRILVGSTSLESIPDMIFVMGKELLLSKSMRRYYDLVLNEQEIIHCVRTGYITISVPTSVDYPCNFIDSIEVYVLKREDMTFLQSEVKNSWIGTDFDLHMTSSLFNRSVNDLVTLESIISSIIHSSRLLYTFYDRVDTLPNDLLKLLVRITFVDPRNRIASFIKEFRNEDLGPIVDEGILQGILDFLNSNQAESNDRDTADIVFINDLNCWHLSFMAHRCARLAIEILLNRPSNYIRSIEHNFPNKLQCSLSFLLKRLHDSSQARITEFMHPLMTLALNEAALTVENSLPSIAIVKTSALKVIGELIVLNGCESCPIIHRYVTETKQSLSESQTEAAYCCDICETFPIKTVRYTHTALSDVDICCLCYDAAHSYAASNNFARDVPAVLMNGRQLHIDGHQISCSEINEMKPTPISQLNIAPLDDGNYVNEQLRDTLKKFQLKALFEQISESTSQILSKSATGIKVDSMSSLFNLLFTMIEISDCDDRIILKKTIYEKIIEKISLLSPLQPNQQSVLIDCLTFLRKLICMGEGRSQFNDGKVDAVQGSGAISTATFRSEPHDKPTGFVDVNVTQGIFSLITSGNPAIHSQLCKGLLLVLNRVRPLDTPAFIATSRNPPQRQSTLSRKFFKDTSSGVGEAAMKNGMLSSIALLSTRSVYEQVLECTVSYRDEKEESAAGLTYADNLLSFMCLVFDHMDIENINAQNLQLDCWLSPLCELVMSRTEETEKAKDLLKALCKMTNYSYLCVLNRHIFELSLASLVMAGQSLFEAAIAIREKTLKSHTEREQFCCNDLHIASFLGVNDLISEDSLKLEQHDKISKTLDNLINTISSSQTDCWSDFCFSKISEKMRLSISHSMKPIELSSFQLNPLCLLFWLGCILTGPNQVKAFKLIDMGISRIIQHVKQQGSTCTDLNESHSDVILMKERCRVSLDSVYSFITHFFLTGEKELRTIVSNVGIALILAVEDNDLKAIWIRFAYFLLREIGPRGFESVEFIQFLQTIIGNSTVSRNCNLKFLSSAVMRAYLSQSQKPHVDLSERKMLDDMDVDLSRCSSCLRSMKITNVASSHRSNQSSSGKKSPSASHTSVGADLTKYRIDTITDHTTYSEFACHFQLKTRMEIHEIFVNISDPRGRYAKTICLYYSPRPANNTIDLKMCDYQFWQLCGTLSLSRGCSNARTKLEIPVIASNLKIEYKEMYERNENNKKSDGSKSILCPRCMSHVSDTHGVCVVCGEIALQCRRCRHINYDRLDAFLCVECGYCAHGAFSFEISGFTASKAVAILDDNDMNRSVLQLESSTRLANLTRSLLLRNASTRYSEKVPDLCISGFEMHDKPLSDALLGRVPALCHGRFIYNQDRNNLGYKSMNVSERVRSLLSQVRPSRSSATRISYQDSDVETLFRQALLSSRLLDDTADLPDDFMRDPSFRNTDMRINAIDRSNQGYTSDILSRILRRASDRDGLDVLSGAPDERLVAERKRQPVSSEESVEDIKKLFQLYRETLKDCYDINCKLSAWTKLHRNGQLGTYYCESSPAIKNAYVPSSCPNCSSMLSYHLLLLLKILFLSRVEETRDLVDASFIGNLFDFSRSEDLNHLKRSLIVTLACDPKLHSESTILATLSSRLSTDTVCADILGEIVSKTSSHEFLQLALDTLQAL